MTLRDAGTEHGYASLVHAPYRQPTSRPPEAPARRRMRIDRASIETIALTLTAIGTIAFVHMLAIAAMRGYLPR